MQPSAVVVPVGPSLSWLNKLIAVLGLPAREKSLSGLDVVTAVREVLVNEGVRRYSKLTRLDF